MKQTRRMIIAAAAVVGTVAGGAIAIANVPVSASPTSEPKSVVAGDAISASASTDPERAKLEEQIAQAELTLARMRDGDTSAVPAAGGASASTTGQAGGGRQARLPAAGLAGW